MAPPRSCFFHLLLSCFLLAATSRSSDAGGGAPQLQDIDCSTEGNYTATDAYAAKLNQLLATLPITTVSKNGGFFNGTVGQGTPVVVYGLAMCSADFSRPDCTDCLTAASSNATGLAKRCPGSVTASIMFDQCMIRYSNRSFFGTAETGMILILYREINLQCKIYINIIKQECRCQCKNHSLNHYLGKNANCYSILVQVSEVMSVVEKKSKINNKQRARRTYMLVENIYK
ncbi:hypothetical protein SORBI_3009G004950 [Sorghum bicolor]|uniref:Gnk2-homologous domain-containing protein n=1 Tax=Sorghum bicolor TaxID=4558 RepID=A0A1Z5R002_SORBI|nr:hypothetical protein SORBI_3009G004950 [Sorghum bicolor]OQU77198.1 hypothetical protein SORBI_3009G004950 [Sorghum bicolor]